MKKLEFKVGDEVFVKGRITFNGQYYTYLDLKLTDKDIFCAHYVALNTDDNIVPASDIKPVKKYGVTYEYKYLVKNPTSNTWYESKDYFTSRKEYNKKVACGDIFEMQRITSTKRVRK